MAAILGKWPEHQFTLAENGASAWEMLNDTGRSFDVAFLDINMPGIDGIALLQRLRESPFFRTVQVVICTAANDKATITAAIQSGTRHYLVKPCSEAAIAAKLRQLGATLPTPIA